MERDRQTDTETVAVCVGVGGCGVRGGGGQKHQLLFAVSIMVWAIRRVRADDHGGQKGH